MRKNYLKHIKTLTIAAFLLSLAACGDNEDVTPDPKEAAAELKRETEARAEREAEDLASVNENEKEAERQALLEVGDDREDVPAEEEEEEIDTLNGYPQNATPPDYISPEWESDRVMTSSDAMQAYPYGEVTDFGTFKAKVNSVEIEPSDTGAGNQIRAQIVYANYENYDIPIEDVFNVLVNSEQLHNMSVTNNLGEPLDPVLLAEHEDTIILTANDPNYTVPDEDNVEFTLIRVHSPFNPESYGRYHSNIN